MANRYWIGGAVDHTTDWFYDLNWAETSAGPTLSAGGIPTSADNVFIVGGTSAFDCIATSAAYCQSITTTSAFANALTFSNTFYSVSSCNFDHTGNLTLASSATVAGDADFHIGSGTSAVTVTNCSLDLQGTGNLDVDKASLIFAKIKGAASGKTTTHSSSTELNTVQWELGAGTWTNNASFYAKCTGTNDLTFNASHTINGTASWGLLITAAITVNIPKINASMTGNSIYIRNDGSNTVTFDFQGDYTGPVGSTTFLCKNSTGTTVFNTNNYSITCHSFRAGNNNATNSITYNFGSSILDINGYFRTTDYNAGTTVIELDTSTWSMADDCDIGSNTTINDAATSTWTFDGTTAVTLTSATKTLPSLIVKKTGGGFTCSDALTCYNFTVDAANDQAVSWNGLVLTSSTSVTIDGTGTLNMGNGVTINGASGTLHVGSTVGTVTATSCVVTMNGTTAMVLDDDKGVNSFKSLVLGAAAKLTVSGAQVSIFNGATTVLTLGNDAVLTFNRACQFNPTATQTAFSLPASYTINGTQAFYSYPAGAGITVTYPDFVYSGSATIYFTTYYNMTVNFGVINLGTAHFVVRTGAAFSSIYNFSGAITTASFSYGCDNASGGATFNFGSVSLSVTAVNSSIFNSGTIAVNHQTSTWSISGNYTALSAATYDGTGTLTFTAATATVVTSNGKIIGTVVCNSTTSTITFADAASFVAFTVSATNTQAISWNGTTLTSAGSVTIDGTGTLNTGTGIIVNGASGTLHIGSTVGNLTGSACTITMNCLTVGVIDIDYVTSATYYFKALVLGISAVVTHSGAAQLYLKGTATAVTLGASASLTFSQHIVIIPTVANTPWSLGAGSSFVSTTNNGFSHVSDVDGDYNIPSISFTGGGGNLFFQEYFTGNLNFNGSIVSNNFSVFLATATETLTVNFVNIDVTLTGLFRFGSNVALGTSNFLLGSGIFTIAVWDESIYNTGTTSTNFQTAQISCSGNFTVGSNHTYTDGGASITFTSGTTALTTATKVMPAIVVNKTSGSFTCSDACSCANFTVNAANTVAISWVGTTLTSSTSVTISGYGALNCGNGITVNGASGTFTVASTVGVITGGSCTITMNGTTAMTFVQEKDEVYYGKFVLGASAVVNFSGSKRVNFGGTTTSLTITNGGTLTIGAGGILFMLTASQTAHSITGTPTINGTGTIYFSTYGESQTFTFPAITITGNALLNIAVDSSSTGTPTINLSGTQTAAQVLLSSNSVTTATFNTANNAISASSAFRYGSSTVAANVIYNFGSSVITTALVNPYNAVYTTGSCTINFQTSQWTVTGNFTAGANHTHTDGGATVTFTSGTTALTTNTKVMPAIIVNKTSGSFTCSDACSCASFTVSATNTQAVTWVGFVITSAGNITIDGSGTLNCGNGITCNGASSTVHFGSTLGTVTATSCVLTCNGTVGMVIDDDKGIYYFKSLVLGASAIVTSSGTAITRFVSTATPLTMNNNSSLTNSVGSYMAFCRQSSGDVFSIGDGCTCNGTAEWVFGIDVGGNGITVSVPAFTYTGSGVVRLSEINGAVTNCTIQLGGTLGLGTGGLVVRCIYASSLTHSFNNQDVTCGSIAVGASNALSVQIANYGSGTIGCTSYSGDTYNVGSTTENFQTCTINCSGNFATGSNHTYDGGGTINFTGTPTITGNGKNIGTVVFSNNATINSGVIFQRATFANGKTYTFQADQTVQLLTYTDGDIAGTLGNVTTYQSSSGTWANFTLPQNIEVSYVSVANINGSAGGYAIANDGTSTDGGNNLHWKFTTPYLVSLNPPVGHVGQTIIISGGELETSAGTLYFDSTSAALVDWEDTSISATIPEGVGYKTIIAWDVYDLSATYEYFYYFRPGNTATGSCINIGIGIAV